MNNAYHYQNSFDDGLASEFRQILSLEFTPAQIPNLKAWVDAQNEGSVTKDGGNFISQVDDLSGNNNHAVQTDSAYQPAHNVIINGYKGFDNENNSTRHLRLPFAMDGSPHTVFAVWNTGASVTYARTPFGQHDGSTHRFYLASNNNGADILIGLGSATYPHTLTTPIGINENHLLSVTANGTGNSADIHLDSAFLYSISNYTFTSPSTVNCGINGWITSATNSGSGVRGGAGEILIYDRALSNAERQQIELYLSNKWGIV